MNPDNRALVIGLNIKTQRAFSINNEPEDTSRFSYA
jgi:hypothetical protein